MSAPPGAGRRHLGLFASLYALQGAVAAYFFNYNQIYMESAGVGREAAAAVQSIALLPFVLKFLAGPLSDRFNLLGLGHRKPYILAGLALQSLGLVGLTAIDPKQQLGAFGALAISAVAGMALYDTCCDGMVIDVTRPDERPRVQGTLVASRFLSAMICSVWFGFWVEGAGGGGPGFRAVIWGCAALGLIPLVQAALLPEPGRAADAEAFSWSALRVMVLPRSLGILAFGVLYSTVGYGVEINLSPYYKSIGFRDADVGTFASLRYLGRAAGAAVMPLAMRRLGRGATLALGLAGLAAATAAQCAIGGRMSAAVAGFAFGSANGWDDAVFFVLAMEASHPRMAASTYALFMAATNVSIAGGWLVARLESSSGHGYPPAFLLTSMLSLGALAFIPALRRPADVSEHADGDA